MPSKTCRWFGTPTALAELVKVLAFTRCDVSIAAGGTSIIVVMIIVAPNR
jgi:hypothetical protein